MTKEMRKSYSSHAVEFEKLCAVCVVASFSKHVWLLATNVKLVAQNEKDWFLKITLKHVSHDQNNHSGWFYRVLHTMISEKSWNFEKMKLKMSLKYSNKFSCFELKLFFKGL